MTPLLSLYVDLERAMLAAEAIDQSFADSIRDVMDPIWYALSADERKLLNERPGDFIQGLRRPLGDDLFYNPDPPEQRPIPRDPIVGWRSPA